MSVPKYRQLKVWQKAHRIALDCIELVDNIPNRPGSNRIVDQFIGSSTSVGANIAEGSSSRHGREYIRYLEIALRSATETDNWIQIFKDSKILNEHVDSVLLQTIEDINIEVIKMLIKMIGSLEKKRRLEGGSGYRVYEKAEDYT